MKFHFQLSCGVTAGGCDSTFLSIPRLPTATRKPLAPTASPFSFRSWLRNGGLNRPFRAVSSV